MLALLLALAQTPVTVQLNHDQFRIGDHARVYVQSAQDGYLVVLHSDPEGRIRVLFPLDPRDDDFIRGGRKFEVRGRADRDAFQIESNEGSGTVLAAVAKDPYKFDAFVRNDHWDFAALGGPSTAVRDDPLARLVDITQRMSGGDSSGRFDYDMATYVVNVNRIARGYGYYDPYDAYHYGLGFYDPFCFDPLWGWSSCYGFGYGWRSGYGFGYPFGFGIGITYRWGPTWGFPVRRFPAFPPPLVFNTSRPTRYIPMPTRAREPRSAAPVLAPAPRSAPSIAPRPRATPKSWSGGSRPSLSRGFSGGSGRSSGGGGGGGRSGGGGGGGGGRHH